MQAALGFGRVTCYATGSDLMEQWFLSENQSGVTSSPSCPPAENSEQDTLATLICSWKQMCHLRLKPGYKQWKNRMPKVKMCSKKVCCARHSSITITCSACPRERRFDLEEHNHICAS